MRCLLGTQKLGLALRKARFCTCLLPDRGRMELAVSFRYIFGIPPLILVLLPVTSSKCDLKDKEGKEYENVLMISIDKLDGMIKVASNCLNKEPNFFKKYSCADKKEADFLNRAAYKLEQFLKMNISDEFEINLLKVSQGTFKVINCSKF
ncbi:interleukin-7 [Ctenodactylus gundi]